MKQINTCYCDDSEHELCWDGVTTFANKDCLCCQNTLEEMKVESTALDYIGQLNNKQRKEKI